MKSEASVNTPLEQSLMSNRRFLYLWFASICSAFAFPMYILAEQWYVVKTLHASPQLGWVMMATTLPRVILMLIGGVVADQWSNSRIMGITNLCRAILLFGMLGLLSVDSLNLIWLVIFALLFGILDAFFWPASESIIPQIVSNQQILRANSFLQTTQQMSLIIAPILGGWLIYQFQFAGIFLACAVILLLSGGFVLLIDEPVIKEKRLNNLRGELWEGFTYMKNSTYLFGLLTILIIVNAFISGPVSMGIPLIVEQMLHGDTLTLSYLRSAFGLGALIGAIVVGLLNIQRKRGRVLFYTLLGIGVLLLLLTQITLLWQGIMLLIVIGVGTVLINIPLISMIQEAVEVEMMGRVMSVVMTLSIGLLPLSYALCSTLLASGLSISALLLGSSSLVILYTCFAMWRFQEVRRLD